jgi:hypothetical protein
VAVLWEWSNVRGGRRDGALALPSFPRTWLGRGYECHEDEEDEGDGAATTTMTADYECQREESG